MPRIALGLSYNGAPWLGWQTQPHRRTVQDALEAALHAFVGAPVSVVCAGRTDTGVHAALQVVHLDTDVKRPPHAWVRGVNSHLPSSIGVRWAHEVDDNFHARFSATARRYVYRLLVDTVRSPLWVERAGWSFRPVSTAAMQDAAQYLIGRHDFSSFRSSQCQAASPVRVLHELDIRQQGRFVLFSLRANAFLHHMVRNVIGSLVYVGQGRHPPVWLKQVLEARNRTLAAPTFAAAGLYLTGVEYNGYTLPYLDASAEIRDNV